MTRLGKRRARHKYKLGRKVQVCNPAFKTHRMFGTISAYGIILGNDPCYTVLLHTPEGRFLRYGFRERNLRSVTDIEFRNRQRYSWEEFTQWVDQYEAQHATTG